MELADMLASNPSVFGRTGSSPVTGTDALRSVLEVSHSLA